MLEHAAGKILDVVKRWSRHTIGELPQVGVFVGNLQNDDGARTFLLICHSRNTFSQIQSKQIQKIRKEFDEGMKVRRVAGAKDLGSAIGHKVSGNVLRIALASDDHKLIERLHARFLGHFPPES